MQAAGFFNKFQEEILKSRQHLKARGDSATQVVNWSKTRGARCLTNKLLSFLHSNNASQRVSLAFYHFFLSSSATLDKSPLRMFFAWRWAQMRSNCNEPWRWEREEIAGPRVHPQQWEHFGSQEGDKQSVAKFHLLTAIFGGGGTWKEIARSCLTCTDLHQWGPTTWPQVPTRGMCVCVCVCVWWVGFHFRARPSGKGDGTNRLSAFVLRLLSVFAWAKNLLKMHFDTPSS